MKLCKELKNVKTEKAKIKATHIHMHIYKRVTSPFTTRLNLVRFIAARLAATQKYSP